MHMLLANNIIIESYRPLNEDWATLKVLEFHTLILTLIQGTMLLLANILIIASLSLTTYFEGTGRFDGEQIIYNLCYAQKVK